MRRPVLPVPGWMPVSPLALAAAMALSTGLSVQAQSFTQSGANSTSGPVSLLPFAGNPASLNFGTESIYIGDSAPGSFSALAGAQLSAGALSVANGGISGPAGSIGDVVFTGVNPSTSVRTTVQLGGSSGNRLEIGNWGTGTLTVSAGALLDATVNATACSAPGAGCYNVVGNGAGSTGTLNVTGAGSEVRTLRGINIGQSYVFTNPPNAFTFGAPGGTTNAFVNVLTGGKLSTEGATVGFNNGSPNGNGNEKANGTVVVNGAGSQWVVKHNSVDNVATGMIIGLNAGGQGELTISGGGSVLLDATNELAGAGDYLNLGHNGGNGSLTVTGIGSSLVLTRGGAIQVGRSGSVGGAVGEGSFSVLAGASASATFLNVGRAAGSSGTVLIDGAGSQLVTSGQGVWTTGETGPAGGNIGWSGTGTVTLTNGGLWRVTDGGANTSAGPGSPHINIGRNGGNGKLFVQSGSLVEIISTSINPAPGGADNFNPYMSVGQTGGTGELTINGGGRLLLTGNAPPTPAFTRGTTLNIGGDSDTAAGGTGTVKVGGPGSELRVAGADGFIAVGRNGTGRLELSNQALVETTIMNVGRGASGNGTLTMDNSTLELSGQWTGNPFGASLSLGLLGGTGVATITNNSLVTISNAGSAGVSLNIGGTTNSPLGHGELTLDGGSKINFVTAAGPATMTIGRDGSGIVTVSGASTQIDLGTGSLNLAALPTGSGTLSINGGAKVLTGIASLAGTGDTSATAGGTASVTVSGNGSELRASGPTAFIGVGRGGTGSLTVENGGKVAATAMSVGRNGGDGTLNVNNATVELSGQQTAGNLVGANLAIGLGGAIGRATINNGSTVNITNYTSVDNAGANLTIGGSGNYPFGSGTLELSGGSQINVLAAAGVGGATTLGAVTIGNNGTGRAELSGGSSINVGSGSVYVARQLGSTGTLVMNGSTLNAGFVGVGVGSAGIGNALGAPGGTAKLVLNDSTINTSRFELGANGLLTGNNGTISAGTDGPVVIAGTISPGNSPGRLRIKCDITMLSGSKLILEINDRDGGPGVDFDIDQLIIGSDSTFDLNSLQIIFSFMGSTNPNEFAASEGGFNLDKFLLASGPDDQIIGGLSSLFGNAQNPDIKNWDDAVNSGLFAFESSAYKVTDWTLSPDGKIGIQTVAVVPEPASFGLVLLALAAMGVLSRRRVARRV